MAKCFEQRFNQDVVVKRFYDKILRPEFHAAYSKRHVGIGRKEHHVGLRAEPAYLAQPVYAFVAVVDGRAEVHVEQYHLRLMLAQQIGYRLGRSRCHYIVYLALHQYFYGRQYIFVIIDDQQSLAVRHIPK